MRCSETTGGWLHYPRPFRRHLVSYIRLLAVAVRVTTHAASFLPRAWRARHALLRNNGRLVTLPETLPAPPCELYPVAGGRRQGDNPRSKFLASGMASAPCAAQKQRAAGYITRDPSGATL